MKPALRKKTNPKSKRYPHKSGNLSVKFQSDFSQRTATLPSDVWQMPLASDVVFTSYWAMPLLIFTSCWTFSLWAADYSCLFAIICFYCEAHCYHEIIKNNTCFPAWYGGKSIELILGRPGFEFWVPDFPIMWPQAASHLKLYELSLIWEIRMRSLK